MKAVIKIHGVASLGDPQDYRGKYFTGGEGTSLGKKDERNGLGRPKFKNNPKRSTELDEP